MSIITAKSGRSRWLPLALGMVTRLRRLKETRGASPFVFAGPSGRLLHRFKHVYFRTLHRTGLAGTRLNIHLLRHTWATRFYEATGDLLLLQKL